MTIARKIKYFFMKGLFSAAFFLITATICKLYAAPPTTITFWHSMSDLLGKELDSLVERFNESQSTYQVNAIYKGNYTQGMAATVAAFRSHEQPVIVQIYEVGTGTMYSGGDSVFYPVNQLMNDNGYNFDTKDFIPAIASYYASSDNKLVSFPLNSSSAVLYYNIDAFKKAGLDPDKPPKTWSELEKDARILMKKANFPYGFTSAWGSWILLENVASINGYPYASLNDGYLPGKPQLLIKNDFFLHHFDNLKRWEKEKVFVYAGRYSQSLPLFISHKVPFYMDSSSMLAGIRSTAKFNFGIASLPYYENNHVKDSAHGNSLVGGGSLWVLKGHDDAKYKGAAAFIHFLARPEIQAEWVRKTGYLPTTKAAWQYLKKTHYYAENPKAEISLESLRYRSPTLIDRGIRLQGMSQLRDLIDAGLERIWSGQVSTEKALNQMVKSGNALLDRFY